MGWPRGHRLPRRLAPLAAPALASALLLSGCGEPRGAGGLECIAPSGAGGGWDLTCRAVGRSLQELGLAPGLVRVLNIPGAGGGIAYAHVVGQRRGDETVLVAASPATTLRLAQGQFAHLQETDVEWLAAVATEYGVIAVRPDSPWRNLQQLMDAWRADPGGFTVSGGSAVGGQDHMKVLLLARAAGLDPRSVRYIPFDGGGEALNALLGGFVEIFSGDATQVEGQMEAQGLRVLAVLAPQRVGGVLEGVPTAREEGFPVDWVTWRGFYLPPGLSPEAKAGWQQAMQTLEESEAWAVERERSRLDPFFMAGDEFRDFVFDQIVEFRALSRELGLLPEAPGDGDGDGAGDGAGGGAGAEAMEGAGEGARAGAGDGAREEARDGAPSLIPGATGARSAADPAGPAALPLSALLLILGGAGASALGWRRAASRMPAGSTTHPGETPAEEGTAPEMSAVGFSRPHRAGVSAAVLFFVYPAALYAFGFVAATIAGLWGIALLFRATALKGFVGALALTLGLYLLFQNLLGLPLPAGALWQLGLIG